MRKEDTVYSSWHIWVCHHWTVSTFGLWGWLSSDPLSSAPHRKDPAKATGVSQSLHQLTYRGVSFKATPFLDGIPTVRKSPTSVILRAVAPDINRLDSRLFT